MEARLYWFPASHPAAAVRKMLELKGIDYDSVNVVPGMQRIQLRLAGFRGGTVPAMRLDGRRVQGSMRIARALEQLVPEPPLFPDDPAQRARAEEAERWGDEELQNAPRLLMRWGLVHDMGLRRWLTDQSHMPMSGLAARGSGPTARYYAHVIGANEDTARRAVEELPELLGRADALLADHTLDVERPNAATLQILSSVRALDSFDDLHEHVAAHPAASAALALFPGFPGPVPRFIPSAWLRSLEGDGAGSGEGSGARS